MPYNLLLLPLLGGFIFISRCNKTRWHALRADKERLLFYAALAGLLHLSLAFLISSIPPFIPCVSWLPCVPIWWDNHVPFPYSGVSVFAFLLGATSWKPLNYFWKLDAESMKVVEEQGGPFEKIIDTAMRQEKRIMITLKSGKVYIGRIGVSFVPGQRDQTILVLPMKSGYREKDQMRLVITTDYEGTYEQIKNDFLDEHEEIIKNYGVVIPVSEIVSTTLYSDLIHTRYFPHNQDTENQSLIVPATSATPHPSRTPIS